MKKCSIKLRDAPSSPVGLAEAQPWQPPWAEPRGARAPGRAGASGSITRASSRHPHRLPLGAQLKTGRLPRVRRGTHGPASGLKAGVQPNAHGEHVWLQVNGPCIPTGPANVPPHVAKGTLLLG